MEEGYKPRFNNFHGWFPRGFYRSGGLCDKRGSSQKLIQDIDTVLEEMNFDINTYQTLRNQTKEIFDKVLNLVRKVTQGHREFTKKENSKKEELIKEGELINKKLDNLTEPVYERLLEKGYSREDLIV